MWLYYFHNRNVYIGRYNLVCVYIYIKYFTIQSTGDNGTLSRLGFLKVGFMEHELHGC